VPELSSRPELALKRCKVSACQTLGSLGPDRCRRDRNGYGSYNCYAGNNTANDRTYF
jgi:hypothetical protein